MQKPTDLVIEDFRIELANLINSHQQLPMSVIVMVVNEMHDGVNVQYSRYKAELRESYQQALELEMKKEAEQNAVQEVQEEEIKSE